MRRGRKPRLKVGAYIVFLHRSTYENLLSRLKVDISEDLAEELLMGDVESVAKVIKAIENELYN